MSNKKEEIKVKPLFEDKNEKRTDTVTIIDSNSKSEKKTTGSTSA